MTRVTPDDRLKSLTPEERLAEVVLDIWAGARADIAEVLARIAELEAQLAAAWASIERQGNAVTNAAIANAKLEARIAELEAENQGLAKCAAEWQKEQMKYERLRDAAVATYTEAAGLAESEHARAELAESRIQVLEARLAATITEAAAMLEEGGVYRDSLEAGNKALEAELAQANEDRHLAFDDVVRYRAERDAARKREWHETVRVVESENKALREALREIQCEIHRDGGEVRPASKWGPEYHFDPESCSLSHCRRATAAFAEQQAQA